MLENQIFTFILSLIFMVFYVNYLMGILDIICYHFHWKS
jgi:uncharacterized membrane protein (DUF485 family)